MVKGAGRSVARMGFVDSDVRVLRAAQVLARWMALASTRTPVLSPGAREAPGPPLEPSSDAVSHARSAKEAQPEPLLRALVSDVWLLAIAVVALRSRPPLDAKRIVDAAARWFSPRDLGASLRASRKWRRFGTCLSRALAVSARLPGSEVVIGVDLHSPTSLTAHAWVEWEGTPLDGEPTLHREIARLR